MNHMLLRLNKHPINIACFEDGTVAIDLSGVEGIIVDQLKEFYTVIDKKNIRVYSHSSSSVTDLLEAFTHGWKYNYKQEPRLKTWLQSFNLGL